MCCCMQLLKWQWKQLKFLLNFSVINCLAVQLATSLIKMQSKYLLLNTSVILFFLPGSWCILNPEQEALRKVEILQETLDYIKEYCPLSKEYDDILLCCKKLHFLMIFSIILSYFLQFVRQIRTALNIVRRSVKINFCAFLIHIYKIIH